MVLNLLCIWIFQIYNALQEKSLGELDSAMDSVIDRLRPSDIGPDQSSTCTSVDQSSINGVSLNGGDNNNRVTEHDRAAEAVLFLSSYFQSQQVSFFQTIRTKSILVCFSLNVGKFE